MDKCVTQKNMHSHNRAFLYYIVVERFITRYTTIQCMLLEPSCSTVVPAIMHFMLPPEFDGKKRQLWYHATVCGAG